MEQESIIFEQSHLKPAGSFRSAQNKPEKYIYKQRPLNQIKPGLANFLLSKNRSVFAAGVDHDFR